MQYLFINHKEFKRDNLKRKKNDLLAIPCKNLKPLVGRICEPYSWQLSLAYAASDWEMYTAAKMNTYIHTHTHTHTHTHQPKTESDVQRRLLGSGFTGCIT